MNRTVEPSRLRRAILILVACAGIVQCWRYRHFMYPDGIQYLDMARLSLSHHAGWLINGYWSPLYPMLLAGAFWLVRPSAYWMYPVVQLVNALCYLAAIAAFDLLLRTLLAFRSADGARGVSCAPADPKVADPNDTTGRFTDVEVIVASSACFVVYVTYLVNVRTMTSDMIVAAAMLAAAACLLRAAAGDTRAWMHAGLPLALGYYAKAVMFPVALIVGAIMVIRSLKKDVGGSFPNPRGENYLRRLFSGARGPAVMLGTFLVAALPLVVALTMKSGHLTFGESGRINYAWYVNRWGTELHWLGDPPESGRPAHPLVRLADHPPAFEFRYPAPVTYALFFDPSYWTDGMRVVFSPGRQAAAFKRAARELLDVVVDLVLVLVPLAAVSVFSTRQTRAALVRHAPALWLALAPIVVYLPVHIEGRFIGASLLIASMVLITSLHAREGRRRSLSVAAWTTAIGAAVIAGPVAAGAVRQTGLDVVRGESREMSSAWQVARALHQLGVPDETDVAAIGANLGADWAQLARVHIVAEIGPFDRPAFMAASPQMRRAVLERLSAGGTRPVVADAPAASVDPDAMDLEQTGFSVVLPRQRLERHARRAEHVQ